MPQLALPQNQTLAVRLKCSGDGTAVFKKGVVFDNLRTTMEMEGNVEFSPENWFGLNIALDPTGENQDVLDIGGEAILGGTVDVRVAAGTELVDGLRVELIRAGKIVGNFNSYNLPTLESGLHWIVDRGPRSLAIVVSVPEVSPLAFMVAAISVALSSQAWRSRRRRLHAVFAMKATNRSWGRQREHSRMTLC